ncbi:MAG: DUF305 domain-containing protein [Rhizobiales bacterium]|nr:DUF305 domain-containing protein [Hyphomicrobiales bacterium]
MKKKNLLILIATAAAVIGFLNLTGTGRNHSTVAAATESESTAAYKKVMDEMMKAMMEPYTGDADVDFVKGMIPHHQGAIDMAKVVLQHGKDAEIKTLAEGIIKEQEREIAVMTEWLAKNGK